MRAVLMTTEYGLDRNKDRAELEVAIGQRN
jgi:hypothetical protein